MSTKRPVDEGAASRNANEVLMLRAKLKRLEERTVIANKSVLEAEKERDKLHKELELIKVQLQGKRARTHDDTGDGHDMHAEVDEWDLRDFRREATRTAASGASMQGQAAAAIVTALRDARAPADQQPCRKRC